MVYFKKKYQTDRPRQPDSPRDGDGENQMNICRTQPKVNPYRHDHMNTVEPLDLIKDP